MQKAKLADMELGNLVFGNSRGEYFIPRETYQPLFDLFRTRVGIDGYGYVTDGSLLTPYEMDCGWIDTPVFTIRHYYWGEDEDIAVLPNFTYKPTGFEMSWYKYPLRDAYCNMDLTPTEFSAMLDACVDSVRKK